MTTELLYLSLSAGLCGVLWLPYILARIQTRGLVGAVGYPDNPPEPPKWAQRSERAHLNLVENLPIFASLVLAAHLVQGSTGTTAAAAAVFFWARVVQAVVHTLGIPWVRTLAFFVAWLAMAAIFVQIVL